MPRRPVRTKRRIGFTLGEPEILPAEPGPEVSGDGIEADFDWLYESRRKSHVRHPFIRAPLVR